MHDQYIPDYNDLFNRHDAEEQAWLEKRPKCDYCGEPITDDECYDINGDLICEECLNSKYKVSVDSYVE